METGKRVFTTDFKRDALDLVERSEKSLALLARELGISDNTLHGWKQQMRAHGQDAFPGSGHQTPPEEELHRLKRENEDQKMLNNPLTIVPIVIVAAPDMTGIQQPFFFIEANGGSRQASPLCQIMNFHGTFPSKRLDLQVFFIVYTLITESYNALKETLVRTFSLVFACKGGISLCQIGKEPLCLLVWNVYHQCRSEPAYTHLAALHQASGREQPLLIDQFSGIAFGVTFIISAIVSPLWGQAADKVGRQPMLFRASLGMAIVLFTMGFSQEDLWFNRLSRVSRCLGGGHSRWSGSSLVGYQVYILYHQCVITHKRGMGLLETL